LCCKELQGLKKIKVGLFLENASIHKSKAFSQHILRSYKILYNTPYSPHLTQIELAFGHINQGINNLFIKSANLQSKFSIGKIFLFKVKCEKFFFARSARSARSYSKTASSN